MKDIFSLRNKVCIVSGGYGHLGTGIVSGLLTQDATVYVLGRNENSFHETFSQILKDAKLFFVKGDVSDTPEIVRAFSDVSTKAGKIDVLVNNAFYSKGQNPETMTDEEWHTGIDGTLSSVFRCTREIIPFLKKTEGKIINVSSMYGVVSPEFSLYDEYPQFLNPPHYGAAKAGVIQLTKYYASYLSRYNINVNCVTPGPFPSPKVQRSEGFIDGLKSRTLLKRIGTPNDLGGVFAFLASDASDFITGQNIIVDGGWTVK